MPVLEFALDGSSPYRVQVHINAHQGPISVMLNNNILGSLATAEEQSSGKDFRLPDNSTLRMCYIHGHLQAWRNGRPLILGGASDTHVDAEDDVKKLGGCATSLVLLNVVIAGVMAIWFLFLDVNLTPEYGNQFPLGLVSLLGLIGMFLLLTWRRWGFYLALGAALLNISLSFLLEKSTDYLIFVPPIPLLILFWYFYSNSTWRQLH